MGDAPYSRFESNMQFEDHGNGFILSTGSRISMLASLPFVRDKFTVAGWLKFSSNDEILTP